MNDLLKAVILGVVEGITEFLPISSTGHLLLVQRWMGIDLEHSPFWKMFTVVIQFGAILSVMVYFWSRIIALLKSTFRPGGWRPLLAIVIGTAPVLVIGYLLKDWIDQNMGSPWIIVGALGIGGILMLIAESFHLTVSAEKLEQVTPLQAVLVGLAQVLAAVFPGTSRSAATIIGGLFTGLSRAGAAEFSFFLAIPAMAAASGYNLLKTYKQLLNGSFTDVQGNPRLILAVGCIVSFLVAWASIAFLMRLIRTRTFKGFAWYRIALAIVVAVVLWKQRT